MGAAELFAAMADHWAVIAAGAGAWVLAGVVLALALGAGIARNEGGGRGRGDGAGDAVVLEVSCPRTRVPLSGATSSSSGGSGGSRCAVTWGLICGSQHRPRVCGRSGTPDPRPRTRRDHPGCLRRRHERAG